MTSTSNNNAVDVMKFICAILVVIIHAPPLLSYSKTADFIVGDIIARIAVPFFFVCAGYFFFNKVKFKKGKIEKNTINFNFFKKYCIHLTRMYAFWTLFYLIWWIPLWYNSGNLTFANMKGYLISTFLHGSYFHLWYLVALFYGLIFTYLMLRIIQVKLVAVVALIFYLIGTFVYSYTWIISENILIHVLLKLYDFLGSISLGVFRAFPYLFMGVVFSKYRIRIPPSVIFSAICLALLGMEAWLLKTSGNSSRFSYILLTGVTLFFIFNTVYNIKLKYNNFYPLLRKMSSIVYFVHPMFININSLILSHYLSTNNSAILFISVLLFSILFSIGLIKLSQYRYLDKLKSVY